jgi:cytochrome c oxidase cbb3-type subunit 4
MDMNTLRIVATVLSFIVFVGIMVWVWRNRKTKDFKEAANLPFTDEHEKNTLPSEDMKEKYYE